MDVREKLAELIREISHDKKLYLYDLYDMFEGSEKIADLLISHGVTVQEWISVKDRFPRKEEYTATAEDGTEYYIRLLIAYKTDIVEYEIGYYDGYKWMTEEPIRLIEEVVAWMPFPNMPQPPKGE